MDKAQQAGYLCNLLSLMEGQESAARPRGTTLANEYNKRYEELVATLKKEHEDEARKG